MLKHVTKSYTKPISVTTNFKLQKINNTILKKMSLGLSSYYLNKTEPNKSCLLFLRELILKQDANISETRKYGMPCFCYKNKMFCYLWADKKTDEPYILFVEGNKLEHPQLESGDRKRMKILRVNPTNDIDTVTIQLLLNKALDLYT